uniref:Glutaredoxin domain-containing protein n=1 Tax=Polytomella parva TaxID=51329 RepID=A0A7S0UUM8_9CHLO|nr:monothiol glutaredoxin (GRX) [Polytomella parva]|mmetsp:Transcript_1872/g.2762  ORF Transcript_1872/g.2762 Transcript_1872/m.2762 type:complete len:321 (+) Transcript_1872:88-1050(+)|eukprot:CAMPEP_0175067412 /NCGR_PEP_ID=MMETSP0052_2-20121109/17084_1 /TAXON_ID=51329 ORGANISM="Polytomella parva, Strain SAG 63-3" /NCGR_SAMPLE_ID=MMETSP0052_2 /ASSEMBLY_ACC=CAM_ASM_000194 /LENGTH=320 /DNA_ID=CAMNT_0016334291 /DNA_START=73 /DNA_END=1035 /DNA_ORIENTATION=-
MLLNNIASSVVTNHHNKSSTKIKPVFAKKWNKSIKVVSSRLIFQRQLNNLSPVICFASLTDTELIKVTAANGKPNCAVWHLPAESGVYAIFDKEGKLQYVGVARKVSDTIAAHLSDLGSDLVSAVKVKALDSDPSLSGSVPTDAITANVSNRERLLSIWKEWMEEAVTNNGEAPPGNLPGDSPWKESAMAAARAASGAQIGKPPIRLTAGKGLTGMTITELIDAVVKDKKAVVFMKGTRQVPQCGFSYRMTAALRKAKMEFDVVDILDEKHNPGIRDAIKNYSQWPTLPQLYVNGEFIGGTDIIEKMLSSGELMELASKL